MKMLRSLFAFVLAAALIASCAPAAKPAAVPPTTEPAVVSQPQATQPAAPLPPTVQPTQPPATAAPGRRLDVLHLPGGDYGYPQPYTASTRGPGYLRESLIFDTLVWKDSSGKMIPWLATSWTPSADGLTWTFKLRPGVKWQDGQPFTADDVAFSIQYYKDKPQLWAVRLQPILRAEKVDDLTVNLILKSTYAPLIETVLGETVIIPKHIYEKVSDPQKFMDPQAVIGTGPYRLVSYDKTDGSYLYEANDDFWMGAPYVKRIELVPVSNEPLALKQGQIDLTQINGVTSSEANDLMKAFSSDPKFGIITGAGVLNTVLYFNMTHGQPMSDKVFRQAVAYSLDLKTMVDKVIFGDGLPGTPAWEAPSNHWKNPDIGPYPYDPAKAKALLDAAGYVDKNGDGFRELPGGKVMNIQLNTANTDNPRVSEMIKAWLADVGVKITIKTMDRATNDQLNSAGKYDLMITTYGLGPDPSDFNMEFLPKSNSTAGVQGFDNARFEELAAQQITEMDPAARQKEVYEMETILAEELPIIPLYYPNRHFVFNKNVMDTWYDTPNGIGGGIFSAWNKHLFITGLQTGEQIRTQ